MMNEVLINSNVYSGAASYAKIANVSVSDIVEKAIVLFLQKVQPKQKLTGATAFTETEEFRNAMQLMDSFVANDLSRPVPAEENGAEAMSRLKYGL